MKASITFKSVLVRYLATIALSVVAAGSAWAGQRVVPQVPVAGSSEEAVKAYLQDQAGRDVRGLRSCYRGEIQKKDREMADAYGGRYSTGVPEATAAKIEETLYRAPAKYCAGLLDANLKPTTDEQKAVYRDCPMEEHSIYLNTFGFESATSGSIEMEGLVFRVEVRTRTRHIVKKDAGYHPDESEIHSTKVQTRVTCRKVAF